MGKWVYDNYLDDGGGAGRAEGNEIMGGKRKEKDAEGQKISDGS